MRKKSLNIQNMKVIKKLKNITKIKKSKNYQV